MRGGSAGGGLYRGLDRARLAIVLDVGTTAEQAVWAGELQGEWSDRRRVQV